MITTGTRVTYEPKDYPVAPWARAMAEAFGRMLQDDKARRDNEKREDQPCPPIQS